MAATENTPISKRSVPQRESNIPNPGPAIVATQQKSGEWEAPAQSIVGQFTSLRRSRPQQLAQLPQLLSRHQRGRRCPDARIHPSSPGYGKSHVLWSVYLCRFVLAHDYCVAHSICLELFLVTPQGGSVVADQTTCVGAVSLSPSTHLPTHSSHATVHHLSLRSQCH